MSETETNYYHHKANVRVSLRATEKLETWVLGILGNVKKVPQVLGNEGEC